MTAAGVVVMLFGMPSPWLLCRPIPGGLPSWPFILAGVIVAWGLITPLSLKPVKRGWMKFSMFIETYIMTPLIMVTGFVSVFAFMALTMRLLGNDPLSGNRDNRVVTYRVTGDRPPTRNLEKPV